MIDVKEELCMIDKNSPLPIYTQIEDGIRSQIENGELKPHDAIPSEREYATQFQISRMTVRQAITNLVNEGLLYREKGRGTFVSEQKIEQQLVGLTSFTEDMKARGFTPSSRLLHFEIIPATAKIASQLSIQVHHPVYEITRIRLADGIPMAIETVYMSANLIKGVTEAIIQQSLYDYVEQQSELKIGHATQTLEAIVATENETEHLQVAKGSPILLIQRYTYLEDGTPLEVVRSAYRADRYKFTVSINRT